jgi:DNA gyrase subunit A
MAEKIIERPINDIISESFIDYAREVIESRALPDIRDGLKPVQRRILYAMHELGLEPDKPFRKSARVVGDVLGKYHPHGDTAVYEAMINMAQPFNRRYVLVEGHGNIGTIDDSAAAMRYTEARMSKIAVEMLKDIDKNTVSWQLNFDDSLKEPSVLPTMFPNLIVNGTSGIAVGIASNIPPHNLGEAIDAICAYIKNSNITIKELLNYIKGPDFPTGGIVSPEGLEKCYETGNGSVQIRAKVLIEELPEDKRQIVITELPYKVSKASLLTKMASYIEGRKEDDVVELRDETDKSGLRIVIEMDKGGNAEKLLTELFAETELQSSFSYNLVALINGKPKVLSIIDMIREFINHTKEIIAKRTEYDLAKATARKHILEGLIKAVSVVDDVIAAIRSSKNPKAAKDKLMKDFGFSVEQSQAILDLRLQRLTALEIKTLQSELKDVEKLIKSLKAILSNEKNILKEVEAELLTIKEKYNDERKTLIKEFDKIELKTKVEKFTLQINGKGKVKKLSENYNGDKGITLKTDSTKNIYVFDNDGNTLKYNGMNFPQSIDSTVINLCNEDEYTDEEDVLFITSDGQIKKSAFKEYRAVKSNSQAIKLIGKAKVINIMFGNIPNDIVLITQNGFVIRFDHTDIRQIGRVASGVRGIKLEDGDMVIGAIALPSEKDDGVINIETSKGIEKVMVSQIKKQGRGGKGIKLFKNDNVIRLLGTE